MVPRVSFINTVILFFWTWYVLIRFDGLQYQINLRGGIIFSYRIRCPALFWNKPFSCRQWVWRSTVNIRDCGLFFSKLGFAPYFCMWHVLDQDFMFPRPRFCTTENKVRAYFTGKGFVASLENVRCDLERWTLESKLGGCTVMNVNIYNDVLCTKLYTCKSQKKKSFHQMLPMCPRCWYFFIVISNVSGSYLVSEFALWNLQFEFSGLASAF